MMHATLITLPCTARELENALHAYCEHHGAWEGQVFLKTEYLCGTDFPNRSLNIESEAEITSETKGEAND